MDPERLTTEERDKLILNMAAAIMDLSGAIYDLTLAVKILIAIITNQMKEAMA
jgi:hypothetical protein